VLDPDAFHSGRAIFAIDRAGRIAYRDISPDRSDMNQIPDNQKLLRALEGLKN